MTIGTDVSTFQGNLSAFQDALKNYQKDEEVAMVGTAARRDLANSVVRQQQIEWAVIHAKTEGEVFAALQVQGNDEIVRISTPAPAAPISATVSLPVEKLGAVAATMDQLSKEPGIKADLEFLLKYGMAVNNQLKAMEDKAKEKPSTPAANTPE